MTGAALTKVFIMSGLMIFIFGFIVGSVSMMFSLGLFRYNLSVEEYLNDSSYWIDVSKSLPYEELISPEKTTNSPLMSLLPLNLVSISSTVWHMEI